MSAWKRCSEEMPEAHEWVAVWGHAGMDLAAWDGTQWCDGSARAADVIRGVTHWQPLPEPPEEGE